MSIDSAEEGDICDDHLSRRAQWMISSPFSWMKGQSTSRNPDGAIEFVVDDNSTTKFVLCPGNT